MSAEDRLKDYEESLARTRRLIIENPEELWIEYDKHNDILYINFGREEADESIMVSDDLILRLKEGKLVGIVISNFSRRAGIDIL